MTHRIVSLVKQQRMVLRPRIRTTQTAIVRPSLTPAATSPERTRRTTPRPIPTTPRADSSLARTRSGTSPPVRTTRLETSRPLRTRTITRSHTRMTQLGECSRRQRLTVPSRRTAMTTTETYSASLTRMATRRTISTTLRMSWFRSLVRTQMGPVLRQRRSPRSRTTRTAT